MNTRRTSSPGELASRAYLTTSLRAFTCLGALGAIRRRQALIGRADALVSNIAVLERVPDEPA